MATAADAQGLEKVPTKTPEVIKTPEEFRGTILRWQQQQLNVLTPFTAISGLAANHGLQSSSVLLSTDRADGDVYDGLPFLKKDEFALAKSGLRKLAECAGISTHTFRTDPRTIAYYWEIKAIASYRGVDGTTILREATAEWDLRDGSPRLKGWTAAQVEEGRKHGLRNCEARAINAAIRECGCGIKQKYTRAELLKPFAVMKVIFEPDMSDPVIKLAVTERALAGTGALYPSHATAAAALPPLEGDVMDDAQPMERAPRPVGASSTKPAAAAHEDADPPPTADAVRIVAVKETSGTNETTKRKWTKWAVIDSRGVEHSTFSKTLSEDAARFRDAKTWVVIDDEPTEDGKYSNIAQIAPALAAEEPAGI